MWSKLGVNGYLGNFFPTENFGGLSHLLCPVGVSIFAPQTLHKKLCLNMTYVIKDVQRHRTGHNNWN